jgi:hypothetical protein
MRVHQVRGWFAELCDVRRTRVDHDQPSTASRTSCGNHNDPAARRPAADPDLRLH